MAERRMFAKTIIDSDAFLDMPATTQLLYFHLSMRADDDGFINKPKAIMRNCRCNDDDMKLLIAKKFIIPFESGVVVVKHWKIHNYIAKDRYTETKYKEEKATLMLDENKAYTQCIQSVYELETQDRLGKDRLVKDSINNISTETKPKRKKFVPPTLEEVQAYCLERNNNVDAQKFYDYYTASEWHDGKGNKVKNWKQKVITWERDSTKGKGDSNGLHETKYRGVVSL